MEVAVEVLMLLSDPDGRWSYRRIRVMPEPGESPDQAARRAGGIDSDEEARVVHSTSWRHLPADEVVLSYAICPDPEPDAPRTALAAFDIARGAAPATPTPENVEVGNVVAHAIQHLAFLMTTDPVVRRALERWPAIAMALEGHTDLTTHPARA